MNTSAKLKPGSTSLMDAVLEHYVICPPLGRRKFTALAPVEVPSADILISDHLGNALSIQRLVNKMMIFTKFKPSILLAGLTFFTCLPGMMAFAQPADSSIEGLNSRILASLGVANCFGDLDNPSLMNLSASFLSMFLAKSRSPPEILGNPNSPEYQIASDIILKDYSKEMKRILYSKLVTVLAQNLSDEQIKDAQNFCVTVSGKRLLKLLLPIEFLDLAIRERFGVLSRTVYAHEDELHALGFINLEAAFGSR